MKIKICGITNLEDALHAVECGADALGFNFYKRSPRYLSPEAADEIIAELPATVVKIGVFVNSSRDEINDIARQANLDAVQLHGDETPEFVARIKSDGIAVVKAIHASDPSAALEYDVEEFLLDTPSTSYGGSGEAFDWAIAAKFKEVVPDFYLAGGLTPDNVADAIRAVHPTAVDVCSGVEVYKGKKDPEKVAKFIKVVRNVS